MPNVVSTFRHAPVGDRLRTTQSMTDWWWLSRMRADFSVRDRD
jgi:hypothetical protein